MKKRIFSIIATLVALICLCTVSASAAQSIASGTYCYGINWNLDTDGVLTLSGNGDMYYEGPPPWAEHRGLIKEIVISDGISSVGSNAFAFVQNATKLTLANSVRSIGAGTFQSCISLEEIQFGTGLKSIGSDAFASCIGLRELRLPDGLEWVSSGAFQNCSNLHTLTFPDSLQLIGQQAFQNCTGLPQVTIPDSVTTLQKEAFRKCTSLKTLTIGSGVTEIPNYAFTECFALSELNLSPGLKTIRENAFSFCSSLPGVVLPEGTIELYGTAFFECSSLKYVVLPASITRLAGAFIEPTLEAVYYYGTPQQRSNLDCAPSDAINAGTWYYVSDDLLWTFSEDGILGISGCQQIGDFQPEQAPWFCVRDQITHVRLPDDLTAIGANAFSGCGNLIGIYLSEAVSAIAPDAFSGCADLAIHTPEDSYAWQFAQQQKIPCTDQHDPVFLDEVAVSCETDGYQRYRCSVCSRDEIRNYIETPGHTVVILPGREATCTIDGTTEGSRCTVCRKKLVDQEVIPASHHYGQWVQTVEPTMTQDGLEERVCSVCGNVDQRSIAKLCPFTDVPADAFYAESVEWALRNGITTGTSPTTFSPNATCTRAQVVTFLWRGSGSPEPQSTSTGFADVPKDAYFAKAVAWALERNITNGISPGVFGPNEPCTRGQVATFLYRTVGSPSVSMLENPFTDVKLGDYYYKAVLLAVDRGITNGTTPTTFSPADPCNRAQIVTFLYRAF